VRPGSLWKITVATLPQAEEAVLELLQWVMGSPASAYTNARTGRTAATVFLPAASARSLDLRSRELRAGLARLRQCGLETGPLRLSVSKLPPQDWAESWKKHFKPLEIGASLLVQPGWSRRRPRKGQAVVVLDPGLSFGTGQHPTTGFCLRQLTARRPAPGERRSFLDAGMGSGILAIAAAKLGFQPIEAFDFDPEAVRIARANAKRNRVEAKIVFRRQDITRLPVRSRMKYSVICANLLGSLLLNEGAQLVSRLQPGGLLVLAGILKTEFEAVRRTYEEMGLTLTASRGEKEWRSGAFTLRASTEAAPQ
jgi:ribosomal protein L11 methyltransferase